MCGISHHQKRGLCPLENLRRVYKAGVRTGLSDLPTDDNHSMARNAFLNLWMIVKSIIS